MYDKILKKELQYTSNGTDCDVFKGRTHNGALGLSLRFSKLRTSYTHAPGSHKDQGVFKHPTLAQARLFTLRISIWIIPTPLSVWDSRYDLRTVTRTPKVDRSTRTARTRDTRPLRAARARRDAPQPWHCAQGPFLRPASAWRVERAAQKAGRTTPATFPAATPHPPRWTATVHPQAHDRRGCCGSCVQAASSIRAP